MMAVYSVEELKQRKDAVELRLTEKFLIANPSLVVRKDERNGGEYFYEVQEFSLPSIFPADHVEIVDGAKVIIGVHPPL